MRFAMQRRNSRFYRMVVARCAAGKDFLGAHQEGVRLERGLRVPAGRLARSEGLLRQAWLMRSVARCRALRPLDNMVLGGG